MNIFENNCHFLYQSHSVKIVLYKNNPIIKSKRENSTIQLYTRVNNIQHIQHTPFHGTPIKLFVQKSNKSEDISTHKIFNVYNARNILRIVCNANTRHRGRRVTILGLRPRLSLVCVSAFPPRWLFWQSSCLFVCVAINLNLIKGGFRLRRVCARKTEAAFHAGVLLLFIRRKKLINDPYMFQIGSCLFLMNISFLYTLNFVKVL